jgi:hypothetical protein
MLSCTTAAALRYRCGVPVETNETNERKNVLNFIFLKEKEKKKEKKKANFLSHLGFVPYYTSYNTLLCVLSVV